MKRSLKSLFQRMAGMILSLGIITINGVFAQEKPSIEGKLLDGKNNQAVPFATVALMSSSDSAIIGGAMSDENGVFRLSPLSIGNYMLRVSNIGYKPITKSIEVKDSGVTDAGIMILQDTSIMLKELVIVGDRIKAKSGSDRTIFLNTKKIIDASNTGVDVLRLIPGIQVDLMHNISLEGSQEIMIYVDGKERDKNFVSQLNPDQIDKIELISAPPSNYDGNITGAINIILKKERDGGFKGQIVAEIPTSSAAVYIFPSYSLNWDYKKLNLYTSYNGEMTYLNIHQSGSQKLWNGSETTEIVSNQYVRQKNWSNRFHFGLDYFLSDNDQFNVYAFYNPFSRELDGTADSHITGTADNSWEARKEDTDINNSSYYSIYYKHSFNKKGGEITTDISNYHLRAENRTDFIYIDSLNSMSSMTNTSKPNQNVITIKTDYSVPLSGKLNLSTGIKSKFQALEDNYNNFNYTENIFAAYGSISYNQVKYDLSAGLRTEKSVATLKDSFTNPYLAFLPYATFRYKITSRQNLQLSFNRSVTRPNIYQLNPFTSINDPYTVSKGNPYLKPELHGSLYLEHSVQFKGNYFASRLFYNKTTDAINNLTFINDTTIFETQVQNLGNISQYGMQFSGSFKLGILTLNPYLKLFGLYTTGNQLAKSYSIENRNSLGFESGLSAIASFRHDLTFSLTYQYSSPENDIQGNTFSDMLYFISLEKAFKQKFKVGIVSAIPFVRSFTYQGSEINGPDFSTHSEGNVKMPVIPFWFKLSYQFSSGKNRDKINHSSEEPDLPKKGF